MHFAFFEDLYGDTQEEQYQSLSSRDTQENQESAVSKYFVKCV